MDGGDGDMIGGSFVLCAFVLAGFFFLLLLFSDLRSWRCVAFLRFFCGCWVGRLFWSVDWCGWMGRG